MKIILINVFGGKDDYTSDYTKDNLQITFSSFNCEKKSFLMGKKLI